MQGPAQSARARQAGFDSSPTRERDTAFSDYLGAEERPRDTAKAESVRSRREERRETEERNTRTQDKEPRYGEDRKTEAVRADKEREDKFETAAADGADERGVAETAPRDRAGSPADAPQKKERQPSEADLDPQTKATSPDIAASPAPVAPDGPGEQVAQSPAVRIDGAEQAPNAKDSQRAIEQAAVPQTAAADDTAIQGAPGAAMPGAKDAAGLLNGGKVQTVPQHSSLEVLAGEAEAVVPAASNSLGESGELAQGRADQPGAPAAPVEPSLAGATPLASAQSKDAAPGREKLPAEKSSVQKPSDAKVGAAQPSVQAQLAGNEPKSEPAAAQKAAAMFAPAAEQRPPALPLGITDPGLTAQSAPDTAQSIGLTTGSGSHASETVLKAQMQGARPHLPVPDLAVQIARQFEAGSSRFEIRLDPPELGRIDVRLEIADDGAVRAHLSADRPETLDLLQRDSRALERALQSLGLDARDGALDFSLRQDGGKGRTAQDQPQPGRAPGEVSPTEDPAETAPPQNNVYGTLRINIVI